MTRIYTLKSLALAFFIAVGFCAQVGKAKAHIHRAGFVQCEVPVVRIPVERTPVKAPFHHLRSPLLLSAGSHHFTPDVDVAEQAAFGRRV